MMDHLYYIQNRTQYAPLRLSGASKGLLSRARQVYKILEMPSQYISEASVGHA
jgi:hypothetical protein